MGFFIFFDIGWLIFFFVMMIGGAIIAVSEASTATAGYLVDNMVRCCFIFFIFILVLSIIEYVGMIKDRGLKSGILRFIAWNVGNVLLSIPLITFVYVSIIPQTNTSLVNMIISGVFFFFVILGMLSVYTKAMESIIDERYEDEDGIMVNLYVTAILGLVVGYFLNRFVVSNTAPSIYIRLYGERLGGLILSIFSKAK